MQNILKEFFKSDKASYSLMMIAVLSLLMAMLSPIGSPSILTKTLLIVSLAGGYAFLIQREYQRTEVSGPIECIHCFFISPLISLITGLLIFCFLIIALASVTVLYEQLTAHLLTAF